MVEHVLSSRKCENGYTNHVHEIIHNTQWVRVYLEGEFIHRIVYTISTGQTIVLDLRHTAQC